MKQTKQKKQGFTVIELLVVISIIALLSSTVLVTLRSVRTRARDAKRVADTRNLLNALALEYSNKGKLPCHWPYDGSENYNYLQPLVTDNILLKNPKDPLNSGNYLYSYMSFSNTPGGPCGQVAYIDYTTENPITSCVGGGILFGNNHCHVFFPGPPNCPNWTDYDIQTCNLADGVNDW